MWTSLKITNWSGIEEIMHVTGFTPHPGRLAAFHKRDLDTGHVVYQDNGRPALDLFWLASPEPGVKTVKKIEVFTPFGALMDTILGEEPVEADTPKSAAPKPRAAPKRKAK